VTATDLAGRTNTATTDIVYSGVNPTVAITTPASSPIYVTATPYTTMAGTSWSQVGIASVSWVNARGGSGTCTGTTSWTIASIVLQQGHNNITVTATDLAGRTNTAVTDIVYSGVNPTVAVTTPASSPIYVTATPYTLMAGTSWSQVGISSVTWVNDRGGSGTCTGTTSWTIASIALSQGHNNITVTATDLAGRTNTATTDIVYSGVNPTVAITTPASSPIYVTATPYTLMAGTSWSQVGIASVSWVNARGGSGTCTGTTSWTIASIALQPGYNNITVTATDNAGRTGTVTRTIIYDEAAPTVTITTPASTIYVTSTPYTSMAGTSFDTRGVASISWANARGGSGTATGTTSWTIASITLQAGYNNITVTATDNAGRTSTATRTIVYDEAAPTVAITTPASSSVYVNTQPYTSMAGTSWDARGVASVTWVNSLGGSGTATGTTSWTIASMTLSAGSNVITVTATDNAGRTSTATVTIVYDDTAPTVTILTPTTSTSFITNAATIDLTGNATDDLVLTSVTWTNAAGGASGTATGTTTWNVIGIALSMGVNMISVTTLDAAGNSATSYLNVTYDSNLPTCTITEPSIDPTYSTSDSTVDMSGTASDDISVSSVTWENLATGESGTAVGTTSWTINGITLADGDNEIIVTAHDSAGNVFSDTLTVTKTAAIPEFSDMAVVVLGAIVVFFLVRSQRRKIEEQ
jgi:hypothetical protein